MQDQSALQEAMREEAWVVEEEWGVEMEAITPEIEETEGEVVEEPASNVTRKVILQENAQMLMLIMAANQEEALVVEEVVIEVIVMIVEVMIDLRPALTAKEQATLPENVLNQRKREPSREIIVMMEEVTSVKEEMMMVAPSERMTMNLLGRVILGEEKKEVELLNLPMTGMQVLQITTLSQIETIETIETLLKVGETMPHRISKKVKMDSQIELKDQVTEHGATTKTRVNPKTKEDGTDSNQ
jgi:hypothetical protein